ncbi:extracellular solute-binding protein [Paenibacillus nasutitermitis]|uniref:ABC transporter substrate-binding protein n=1 Tax=Paenibacillus nasutitermitis TaxID=1652958 RepID=A0A916ZFL7_9BACL|nr:extracellular solute-binding protein [Paenibacillus nasutitermitis]GGD93510.1 ABC transporter substrate-binding protein [Paenibacillus nasutitermitis]
MRNYRSLPKAVALLLIIVLAFSPLADGSEAGTVLKADPQSDEKAESLLSEDLSEGSSYQRVLSGWQAQGATDAASQPIEIEANGFASASGQPQRLKDEDKRQAESDGKSGAIGLYEEKEWVEYEFTVEQAGFYNLNMEYYPLAGSFGPIQMGITIDGEYPFQEAAAVDLDRTWRDKQFPLSKDGKGNEIRSLQEEIRAWTSEKIVDSNASYAEAFRWMLSKGTHLIRVQTLYDPVLLAKLEFTAPLPAAAYRDIAGADVPSGGEANKGEASNWYTVIEAERMSSKSDSSLQMTSSMDDLTSPKSKGKITFNMVGGDRWKRGGQWAEWQFEVPEDGEYTIHLKYSQAYRLDASVFRNVTIDGKLPFAEMQAFPFPYASKWKLTGLEDADGVPYRFNLKAGNHTLRLEATHSPLQGIIASMQAVVSQIQQLNREVRLVTGVRDPLMGDANRDWNLAMYIPDIVDRYTSLIEQLEQQLAGLEEVYGKKISGSDGIRSGLSDLKKLQKNPNLLPKRPEMLMSIQETLAAFMTELREQPLDLDLIIVSKPDAKLPSVIPNWRQRLGNTVSGFFDTFSGDYNYYGREDEDAITVWVNRGRDYVNLMQQMADEQFTQETGIKVNINLMPNPQQLILSNAAGREPDVALSIDPGTIVDFAMRNALLDLGQFADYANAAEDFSPGLRLQLSYDGGQYGLPETLSPNIMFVRNDLFEGIGIEPPQTWEEVYALLPDLQQRGYDFFTTPANYLPFVLQNGADFFSKDGMKSGLDTPEGFAAFKQWTDLFKVYGFPREVPNFYMHFRNGDMPIGISDYNTYLQLLVAAPEIAGLWSIYPIPGVLKDGEIERWAGGAVQAGMIFRTTERAEESWDFLQWWVSEDVQSRFGTDIEQLNGTEFRWNTANVQALKRLPWPKADAQALFEQLSWFKEMPIVPGFYFTPRELNFAWNRTVLGDMNYRESLESSILEINREMRRKLQEFGLVDDKGDMIRPLQVPQFDEKWEGRDQH